MKIQESWLSGTRDARETMLRWFITSRIDPKLGSERLRWMSMEAPLDEYMRFRHEIDDLMGILPFLDPWNNERARLRREGLPDSAERVGSESELADAQSRLAEAEAEIDRVRLQIRPTDENAFESLFGPAVQRYLAIRSGIDDYLGFTLMIPGWQITAAYHEALREEFDKEVSTVPPEMAAS